MVDVELHEEERYAILKTDKLKTTYTVVKDNSGHRFFEFKVSDGPLPKQLQGKFSSLRKAVEAFENYERVIKQSFAVKREEIENERKTRRAKLQSENQ